MKRHAKKKKHKHSKPKASGWGKLIPAIAAAGALFHGIAKLLEVFASLLPVK